MASAQGQDSATERPWLLGVTQPPRSLMMPECGPGAGGHCHGVWPAHTLRLGLSGARDGRDLSDLGVQTRTEIRWGGACLEC